MIYNVVNMYSDGGTAWWKIQLNKITAGVWI